MLCRFAGLFIFCLAPFFVTNLYAACVLVPCNPLVEATKIATIEVLNALYDTVDEELDKVKESYEDELDELKKINTKLEKQIELTKKAILSTKQAVFLLKQNNELEGVNVNIDALNTLGDSQ